MLFYRQQAQAYFDATRSIDMQALYARFVPHVAARGRVLDAGCGSGRDTLAFKRMGFTVAAFDASPELAALASTYAEVPVQVMPFCSPAKMAHALNGPFDGIWACASLLHVPEAEQHQAWAWLWSLLRPGGMVYASYKLGQGERTDAQGRHFTDANPIRLDAWLRTLNNAVIIDTWQSQDLRPGEQQTWFNAIVHQKSDAT